MFLRYLNETQKVAFFSLANLITEADSVVRVEEDAMLLLFKIEMGWPEAYQPNDIPLESAVATFDTRESKVAAMLELIGLSIADDHLDEQENALLQEIGTRMGLPASDYELMLNWVVRQCSLLNEARHLLGMEV